MTNEPENQEQKDQTNIATAPENTATVDVLSLAGDGAAPQQSGDAERIAALERELQQERVEKGRLRQTSDELRKAQEEIARLKAENASLSQRRPSDFLSDEERAAIDPDQLAVIDKLVKGRMGDASAAVKAEADQLREELHRRDASAAQMAKAQFNAEVERLAPGLAAAINDRRADWEKWSSAPRRAASVAMAFKSLDAATVAEFLQEFAQSNGVQANVDGLAARPGTSYSPRGGNHPVSVGGDQTTYTVEQFSEAMRQASDDYNAGRITADDYRAIKKKFDTALNEGRVVPK